MTSTTSFCVRWVERVCVPIFSARPAILSPSATRQAPVSVARSSTAAFLVSVASARASASTSRPSASVLSTSTVVPLRAV